MNEEGARKRRNNKLHSVDLNGEVPTPHGAIGIGLRRMFNEIVDEPIPADFLQLLDQIDRKDKA